MASVSESMLKTRQKQWKCYVQICKKFKWDKYYCNSMQACKYVTFFIAKIRRYSSVINYYQMMVFYHNVKGRKVANGSDVHLAHTVKGITNSETSPEDVK